MIQYVCDTCMAVMKPDEEWIVGLAAEAVGMTSARREISIQAVWSRATAVHELAVHFCSIQCEDEYVARLFADSSNVEGTQLEEVTATSRVPGKIAVLRTAKNQKASSKTKTTAKPRTRRKRIA
jgi:hypothetical protein